MCLKTPKEKSYNKLSNSKTCIELTQKCVSACYLAVQMHPTCMPNSILRHQITFHNSQLIITVN